MRREGRTVVEADERRQMSGTMREGSRASEAENLRRRLVLCLGAHKGGFIAR